MMKQIKAMPFLAVLMAVSPVNAGDAPSAEDLTARAAQGDTHAQVALAVRYRDGEGVSRDYAKAMHWAHLAADRGDAAAMDFGEKGTFCFSPPTGCSGSAV